MQELIGELVKQLGVSEAQAKGGAGALLKLAKDKLGGDFSQISTALGGVDALIKAAPSGGLGASLLGGLGKAVGGAGAGDLAALVGVFGQLKLDPAMIGKFAPILVSLVQSKAGPQVAALLAQVLKR